MPMGEVGRHRQSQQPRQMRQKIMYQSGRTLEFVGAALTGRRVRKCTVCRASKGRAHRLFVCVFSFSFSLPLFSLLFLRSYYGVADENKWCSVQVQFTEPMGKNCSSTSSRRRVRTTTDTDNQLRGQLPGRKRMRVSDAAGLPTDVTLLGPTTLS